MVSFVVQLTTYITMNVVTANISRFSGSYSGASAPEFLENLKDMSSYIFNINLFFSRKRILAHCYNNSLYFVLIKPTKYISKL